MKKYKVWVSSYQGNGQYEEDDLILEFRDGMPEDEVEEECLNAIWDLLHNIGVSSGWEEMKE